MDSALTTLDKEACEGLGFDSGSTQFRLRLRLRLGGTFALRSGSAPRPRLRLGGAHL